MTRSVKKEEKYAIKKNETIYTKGKYSPRMAFSTYETFKILTHIRSNYLFLDMNEDKKNINEKLAKHILSVTFNKTCTKMYKLCQEFENICLAINGRQPNIMLCG